MLRAGAQGYIMKSEGGAKLLKAVRQILQGRPYISERLSARILDVFSGHRSQVGDPALSALTDRELRVFELLGQGKSTRKIAAELEVDMRTIETYRARIREKLQIAEPDQLLPAAIAWVHSRDST